MQLEHVALSITVPEDSKNFYENILGMEKVREFVLPGSLAHDIFGIDRDTPVVLYRNDRVFFEIFIINTLQTGTCNHVCLAFDNRKSVFEKAQQEGYTGIYRQKESSELFFIKDGSGNVFELKDIL